MTRNTPNASRTWAAEWISAVADGHLTMSQRKRSSVDTKGGGLEPVIAEARGRGVHLALFVDDHGQELVVASLHPIEVLC